MPPAAWWQPDCGATTRQASHAAAELTPGDAGFLALCRAYRSSGGLARVPDAAHCLAGRSLGDAERLAALIDGGWVFTLAWQGQHWVPMFQLDPHQHARRVGAYQARTELGPVFDGWSVAAWLVRGNAWLAGQRPLDLLANRLPAVLAAARTDRFVAAG